MSGSANEIDRARAQGGVGFVDRKNQLKLDIEPLFLKNPSSIAVIGGKYEFEIISGTASFIVLIVATC
jgi:hypothetical protein